MNLCCLLSAWLWLSVAPCAVAHPLGNFAISHFTRLTVGDQTVRAHYVVDYAEIAAFQEILSADGNHNGKFDEAEQSAWLARTLPQWLDALKLTANGRPLVWQVLNRQLTLPPGAVGLHTLRVVCELEASHSFESTDAGQFNFSDGNHADRQGWHELVLTPDAGVHIFDSTAFADGLTDELKNYHEGQPIAPLDERTAQWSATIGAPPAHAHPLLTRAHLPVITTHLARPTNKLTNKLALRLWWFAATSLALLCSLLLARRYAQRKPFAKRYSNLSRLLRSRQKAA